MSPRKNYLLAFAGIDGQQAAEMVSASFLRDGCENAVTGSLQTSGTPVLQLSLPEELSSRAVQGILERVHRNAVGRNLRAGFFLATLEDVPEALDDTADEGQARPIEEQIRLRARYSIS